MANQETILFSPEISERDLDREVDDVNDQLAGVGEDVPVSFDSDGAADGLMPAGAGGGGGGRGMGLGQGAAGGALASKLPSSVSGVLSATAMPVALAGGVGVGMLASMQQASARLQTSTSLLGQAWRNVWAPIGNRVDELFVRDAVMSVLDATEEFRTTWDAGNEWAAVTGLLGDATGWLADITQGVPIVGGVFEGISGGFGALEAMFEDRLNLPSFPGWPDINPSWPGWPSIDTEWPGWPSIDAEWPGWPSIHTEWQGWPEIGTPSWPSAPQILDEFPELSVSNLRDAILDEATGGDSGGGGGGGGGGGFWDFDIPWLQGGGRVQRTGAAVVHRNEIVADEQRLVSELASAVSQSTGGRSRTADTGGIERRLDRLHDDLRRLESALDVTLEVGREEIGRAAAAGKREEMADTDPLI